MTKLTLAVPTVGEKNTVAEPKVDTALKAVEEFLNGAKLESTDNIKPEGIAEASLSKALQEKLAVRLGFVFEQKNASFTAESEKFYELIKTGSTVTLPAPTANRIIAGFVGSGTTGVKVKPESGSLYGDFLVGVTEAVFTSNQHFIWGATGSNWLLLAGEPKNTNTFALNQTWGLAGVQENEFTPSTTRPTDLTVETTMEEVGGVAYFVGAQRVGAAKGATATISTMGISVPPGEAFKAKSTGGGATTTKIYTRGR